MEHQTKEENEEKKPISVVESFENNEINNKTEQEITPENEDEKDVKPIIENKSSMEILSELFSTFHADPPVLIIPDKKSSEVKKHKKKKKHKSKDKKHKKKSKKRKRSDSSSSDSSNNLDKLDFDLAQLLVKEENKFDEKKIKIVGTDISLNLDEIGKINEEIEQEDVKPSVKKLKSELKKTKILSDEGEISSDDHKSKHKHKSNKHKHKREKSKEKHKDSSRKSRSPVRTDLRQKIEGRRTSTRHSSFTEENDFYKSRNYEKSSDRDRTNNDFYNPKPRGRSFDRSRNNDSWYERRRSRERKYHDYSSDKEYIDKKKLLAIARKNAMQMMKSGSLPGALSLGPQAQEKMIAAIKSGGKTIEELTEFCKTLSRKEDLGELSEIEDQNSDSDNDVPFHHPFQIKERPTTITMNIKNSVPLPIKSTQERTAELRMQFPVSSGQQHRTNEGDWVPVEPKKVPKPIKEISTVSMVPPKNSSTVLSTVPAIPVSYPIKEQTSVDISAIVSQRLTAMRRLQENPDDEQALTQIAKASKEVQSWAVSKQQPGQFTGSVAGNFLTPQELSSGYQAWAKKDQFHAATPVSGGMGMHLLQKMGWKPGEALGKNKTGALEPLLLDIKLDKKGLVADEEAVKKKKNKQQKQIGIQGKHPVSALGEYASKNKIGAPLYELCFEYGPDHKKNFLFKVTINGMTFQPNVASLNKKEAKANAAKLCLEQLGIFI